MSTQGRQATDAEVRRAAALIAAKRRQIKDAILGELHPLQREVAEYAITPTQDSKWIALTCGRRAGKTELDVRLIALALLDSGPNNELVGYAAVTRKKAEELVWRPLRDLISRFALDSEHNWKINESTNTIEVPGRATFQLMGFDKYAEIEKLRGSKFRLFICDEPDTYDHLLEPLISKVIEPTLGDVRGTFLINGTPGHVNAGTWHAISTGNDEFYRRWHWTVHDNPFFPDPEGWLASVRKRNGFTDNDAIYLREYLARWTEDEESLVYAFNRSRNTLSGLPRDYDPASWVHTLGIDYGFRNTAWSVLASPPHRHEAYCVHAEREERNIDDDIADHTHELIERFSPVSVVGDSADQKAIEAYNRRWGSKTGRYIRNANKREKLAHIGLLNTELRTGRLTICEPDAEVLIQEMSTLPWKNGKLAAKREENKEFPNHACDATLYAFMEHRSYLHRDAPRVDDRKRWDADGDDVREERWKRFVEAKQVGPYEKAERAAFGHRSSAGSNRFAWRR